jgi:hypothetical protein
MCIIVSRTAWIERQSLDQGCRTLGGLTIEHSQAFVVGRVAGHLQKEQFACVFDLGDRI